MMKQLCYNRGCGKTFCVDDNNDLDACVYHPGTPYFHDAIKGWSCCDKKSTDFTVFLNFEGCTRGKHSNVKPAEPEHITGKLGPVEDPEPLRPSIESTRTKIRPDVITTRLVRVEPKISLSLKRALEVNKKNEANCNKMDVDEGVKEGESCKRGGCKATYKDENQSSELCEYHPGFPIFHEGLKFWSCCQRRTTDFQAFLDQKGCESHIGHLWRKQESEEKRVKCRQDWHQTASNVTFVIYAKNVDPAQSTIDMNPVRLKVKLALPQDKHFETDMELNGIVNVEETKASMAATKVEIVMPKGEPGTWTNLFIQEINENVSKDETSEVKMSSDQNGDKVSLAKENTTQVTVDDIDLDDLELSSPSFKLATA